MTESGFLTRGEKGMPEGAAPLNSQGKVPLENLDIPAISVPYTPAPNSSITSKNTQTAIDQLAAIITQQQQQILLLTPSQKPPLIECNFTSGGLLDTPLDLYVPDTNYQNSRWVKRAGNWAINGNTAKSDGTAASFAWIESGQGARVIVQADITLVDTNVPQGLAFRFNPTNGYHWRAVYTKTKFEILEITASTVSRVSFPEAIAFNQTYRFKVLLDNNVATLYVDGNQKCSWNNTTLLDQTKHGLYASTSAATRFDNYKILPL